VPPDVLGEEERDRPETQISQRFRRSSAGRIMVAESGMKPALLTHSMGDLAALADFKGNKEDEIRSERGLPPVPWGDLPWLPANWLPSDPFVIIAA
jgi:hypothetical protein